uniref:Uncharacterized protein n=1 Tax=Pseudomonas fluorescens (strain SBW25) TaxID=216595 RepID=A0A0G4E520_PSEFS|nr:hypothetical protein [Pseudomonas fluorescens]CEK42331.1 hypothetical protein PQBR57_0378 [Pseudomonas fluorescens SBW25]
MKNASVASSRPYSIEIHRHNYARWCAARAYGRGLKGGGNKTAFDLIEASGLQAITKPEHIETDVDGWLLGFMRKIEVEAKRRGIVDFTFGHAQKLVNIYLKTVLVCGEHYLHPQVVKLHPPLDFELFKGLGKFLRQNKQDYPSSSAAFSKAQKANPRWTAFSEADYMAHINAIKSVMGSRPLYEAEEHWRL